MIKHLKSEALRFFANSVLRLMLYNPLKFRILTFHSIQDHADDRWHTSPKVFKSQMCYLSESGYSTFNIADIAAQWPDILNVEKAVALTFDDGLLNNYTVVCDILIEHNMKATFFICTESVSDERTYPMKKGMDYFRDTPMLCWDDIRLMRKSGFEIGSHSHSHEMITKLSRAEAFEDIVTSKKVIEAQLNENIYSFAYPYGRRDAYAGWTRGILKESGFKAGCTQMGGALSKDNDLLELPRIGIKGSDTLDDFRLKVLGCYDFLKWL